MSDKLLSFPCVFPIKVIGKNTPEYQADIIAIAKKHDAQFEAKDMKTQHSKQSQFISYTLNIHAQSQTMLDALYQDLSKHPLSKMVL